MQQENARPGVDFYASASKRPGGTLDTANPETNAVTRNFVTAANLDDNLTQLFYEDMSVSGAAPQSI